MAAGRPLLTLLPMPVLRVLPALTLLLLIGLAGVVDFSPGMPMPPLLLSWGWVYYWSMFQPGRMPYALLAVSGVAQDVLLGFPLGASALALMALRAGASYLRRIIGAPNFMSTWMGFGVAALALSIAMAGLFSYVHAAQWWDGLLHWLYTAVLAWVCYPPLHWLSNRMYLRSS